jgi:hypothetical protein
VSELAYDGSAADLRMPCLVQSMHECDRSPAYTRF